MIEPATSPDAVLTALRVADATPPSIPDDPERPVAIVLTSGTTGRPKGAVFAGRHLDAITATTSERTASSAGVAAARCWPAPSSPTSAS